MRRHDAVLLRDERVEQVLRLELGVVAVLGQPLGGDDRLLGLLGQLVHVHRHGGLLGCQRSVARRAPASVDLVDQPERDLDAGGVEPEVLAEAADRAQPGQLGLAEETVRPSTRDGRTRPTRT